MSALSGRWENGLFRLCLGYGLTSAALLSLAAVAGCIAAYSTSGGSADTSAAAGAGAAGGGAARGGNADISVTENPDGSRTWSAKSGGGSGEATAAAQAAAEAAARAENSSKANSKQIDALSLSVYLILAWIGLKLLLAFLAGVGVIAKNPLA